MRNDINPERGGVVIDVDPEHEPPPPPAPEAAPAPTKTGRGTARFALALALLALLAVSGALLFGYQHWLAIENELGLLGARLRQTTSQNQALQATLSEAAIRVSEQQRLVEAQSSKLEQSFERQRDALQRQQAALERHAADLSERKLGQDERESRVRAAVAELHRRVGGDDSGWIVAEAEYLLRLADQRLRLAHDPATARSALALAERRLSATGETRWDRVREQIQRLVGTLEAVELPDPAVLSDRLAGLLEAVPGLRLAVEDRDLPSETDTTGSVDTGAAGEEPSPGEDKAGWRAALDELWGGLKRSVRVRRQDRPVPALPATGQRDFLYRSLEHHLESARLALVSGAGKLYRDSLANGLKALDRHFDPTDPGTRAMRDELRALAGIEIRPTLPDLSGVLRALQVEQARQPSGLEPVVSDTPAAVTPGPTAPAGTAAVRPDDEPAGAAETALDATGRSKAGDGGTGATTGQAP